MKTAWINGIILDGTLDMVPQKGMAILTDGDVISAIVPEGKVPAGYEVRDLQGKYILPGLINLHVHTPGTGKPSKKPMDLNKICRLITSCGPAREIGRKIVSKNMKNAVMAGVTTVRAVGGIADFDTTVRNRINSGKCPGPRILAADLAISVPGGHMAGTFAHIANSAEEAESLVDEIAKGKPDLIKLMITGGIMDSEEVGKPGKLLMPEEYVRAACNRAHELGYPVAAHCEGTEGVKVALECGVDTIEHGAPPTDEVLALFKEHGAAQVLTCSPAIPYVSGFPGMFNLSETAVINSKALLTGMTDMAKANLSAGVPVGLGTDSACSYSTQYDMWRELVYFTKYCGVSNSFALHTATLVNAGIAGIGAITGSLEPGKSADMIAVEGNPLENLSVLRDVKLVVARGRVYDNPKVEKYPQVEAALDSLL